MNLHSFLRCQKWLQEYTYPLPSTALPPPTTTTPADDNTLPITCELICSANCCFGLSGRIDPETGASVLLPFYQQQQNDDDTKALETIYSLPCNIYKSRHNESRTLLLELSTKPSPVLFIIQPNPSPSTENNTYMNLKTLLLPQLPPSLVLEFGEAGVEMIIYPDMASRGDKSKSWQQASTKVEKWKSTVQAWVGSISSSAAASKKQGEKDVKKRVVNRLRGKVIEPVAGNGNQVSQVGSNKDASWKDMIESVQSFSSGVRRLDAVDENQDPTEIISQFTTNVQQHLNNHPQQPSTKRHQRGALEKRMKSLLDTHFGINKDIEDMKIDFSQNSIDEKVKEMESIASGFSDMFEEELVYTLKLK